MTKKRVFKVFTIIEYEKEQEYLRSMHKSGWRLVKVSGLCIYDFEECAPEDVIYQLDYNQEGLAHKEEYIQMFRDCGWEYIQDYFGYSYFRKPAAEGEEAEEIFGDEGSKQQMLERVFKGRLVPLFAVFSCILVPQFASSIARGRVWVAGSLGAVILLYVAIFFGFTVKYMQHKSRN